MTNNVYFYGGNDATVMLAAIDEGMKSIKTIFGKYIFVCFDEQMDEYVFLDNRKNKPKIERFYSWDEVSQKLYELT